MNFLDRFRSPKNNPTVINSAEKYLEHLERVFQREPLYFREESRIEGLPGVTTLVYKDFPQKGFITGLTYGLSLVNHPDWKFGRPELCICVESDSMDWAQVAGYIVNNLRGNCPFSYGQTINFEGLVSGDSDMDAFLIFAPGIFDKKEDYLDIDVGTDYKICIAGLYPMYSSELLVLKQIGLEKFWHHPDFDMFDVNRKQILG